MPRKPDYKREKKLREAAQRKRREETQQRKAERKPDAGTASPVAEGTPETP
jgi:hypothetical protein